ncbi:MAG: molybdopterin-synthase adenylyltransferase MoeB [Proteobacteria bacterium]|nr:molybdopterin-synthase adenylyltransferase MoeB [Pseudomonadota bacterium]
MELSEEQLERYSRHLILPEVGEEGQKKLLKSKVFVLGAGGLGSPSLYYLAAAGVGTIGLADGDAVELTNLQRQIIHSNDRVGARKTDSAKQTITGLNPDVNVVTYDCRITADNVREIIRDYDIILDGSDNFPTRFLMNDAAYFEKKPLVSGAMFRFDGQVSVFSGHDDYPCYRCLYSEPPPPGLAPSCNEAGVLGALPGVIGVMQAVEAIKIILGAGKPLMGKLLVFDALDASFKKLAVRKDPECALCSEKATIKEVVAYEEACELRAPVGTPLIKVGELHERLKSSEPPVLLDIRETGELSSHLGHLEGIVHIPLGLLEKRVGELDGVRDREISIICRSGQRAVPASDILKKNNFRNVNILDGGMLTWHKEFGE